jgi:hypothetical protein
MVGYILRKDQDLSIIILKKWNKEEQRKFK